MLGNWLKTSVLMAAGLAMPRVYIIDEAQPKAFATAERVARLPAMVKHFA